MKIATTWIRCLAVGVLLPLAAIATTPSDVAWIAGAASVVGPLVVQGVTRSSLDVTVDVYRETIPLSWVDQQGRVVRWEKGRAPFELTTPLALHRRLEAMSKVEDPTRSPNAAAMTTAANQLQKPKEQLEQSALGLRDMEDNLKQAGAAPNSKIDLLRKEVEMRRGLLQQVIEAIGTYRETVATSLQDGLFTPGEFEKASNQLLSVRLAAQNANRDFSSLWSDYFQSNAAVILANLAEPDVAKETKITPKFAVTLTEVKLLAKPEERRPGETQAATTQRHVWYYVGTLKTLESEGGLFKSTDGKLRELPKVGEVRPVLEKAKKDLWEEIRQMGFLGSQEQLFAADREIEFNLIWDQRFIDGIVRAGLERIDGATFVGVNVGANFGPIANEVIQGVLAENRLIDQITSHPDRWTTFNSASSEGNAGNHNAIVYFENMLTPVLKSATFDPSQLLLANAQIFKRATGVLAQVYGAPTSADVKSGDANASLNLMNVEARKRAATDGATAKRAELLAALGAVIDEHEKIQALLKEDKKDWTDYHGAARAALDKLSTRLAARAADLEKL